ALGGAGGLADMAQPRAPRRVVRTRVLRRELAVTQADAGEARAEARREVRPHRRLAREFPHLPARATALRYRSPGVAGRAHRVPGPPRLPRRRRLLRLGLAGAR